MFALFDKDCELVGWIKDTLDHIFDTDMNWIAYIKNGHAWSANSNDWCGPVNGLTCLDQSGKVVAWNPKQKIKGQLKPIVPIRAIRAIRPVRPINPMRPIKPIKPITPIGGWSELSFPEWIAQ